MHKFTLRSFIYYQLCLGMTGILLAEIPISKLPDSQYVSFYMVGGQELLGEFSQPDKSAEFSFKSATGLQHLSLMPGMKTADFYRATEPKVEIYQEHASSVPGKPYNAVALAEVDVSLTWKNILILLKMDESTGHMSLTPINQNSPAGTVVFFNSTNRPLIIDMGEGQVKVESAKQGFLPIGLNGDTAAMIRIMVSTENEGHLQVVSSGSYAFSAQDRRFVLLEPGKTGRILMSILDVPPIDLIKPTSGSNVK